MIIYDYEFEMFQQRVLEYVRLFLWRVIQSFFFLSSKCSRRRRFGVCNLNSWASFMA